MQTATDFALSCGINSLGTKDGCVWCIGYVLGTFLFGEMEKNMSFLSGTNRLTLWRQDPHVCWQWRWRFWIVFPLSSCPPSLPSLFVHVPCGPPLSACRGSARLGGRISQVMDSIPGRSLLTNVEIKPVAQTSDLVCVQRWWNPGLAEGSALCPWLWALVWSSASWVLGYVTSLDDACICSVLDWLFLWKLFFIFLASGLKVVI